MSRRLLVLLAVPALGACSTILGIDDLEGPGAGAIVGTSEITWAQTDGTSPRTAEDLSGYTIRAYVPDDLAPGGFTIVDGAGTADGHFTIPTAPDGAYLVEVTRPSGVRALFAVDRRELDAGYVTVGRAGAAVATTTTPLSLSITGMNPWQVDDALRTTSFGAGTDLDAVAAHYNPPPAMGETALTGTSVDWFTGVVPDPGGAPPRLVDGAAGDDLWVAHIARRAGVSSGSDPITLITPIDVFSTTAVAMTDGGTATATGAFTATVADQALHLSVDLHDWLAARIPSEGAPVMTCVGYKEPGAAFGIPAGFGLWAVAANPPMVGTVVDVQALQFPDPLPASWPSMVHCDFQFSRDVSVPGLGSGQFAIRSSLEVAAGPTLALKAALAQPRNATFAGVVLDSGGEVTLDGSPVPLRWDPVADASQYQIVVRRLTNQAGQAVVQRVATIDTTEPSVALPAAMFDADTSYVLNVIAIRATGGLPGGQLRRVGAFGERAATLSESITIRK